MRTEITDNGYHLILKNGYRVSVIGGDNYYGNGKSSFEVGLYHRNYDGIDSDILVQEWMTDKQIKKFVKTLKKFQ